MSGPNRGADKPLQWSTLVKLSTFSLSLAVVPIASYFLTLQYVWAGNATASALFAVFTANLIIVAFVVVSVQEENKARTITPDEAKKTQ